MIMKKLLYLLSASFILFSSCEKLDGEERFDDYTLEVGDKYVLVEDFTGQRCVNCPDAALMLSNLNKAAQEHLIVVSMHAGGFAIQTPLEHQTAVDYMNSLGLKNNPSVSIDRTNNIDGNSNTWAQPIIERVKLNAVCNIKTDLEYNGETRKLTAKSDITFSETVKEKLGIQYYVLRDGIVNYQSTHDGIVDEYVHNHVFSGTLYTDKWGVELPGDTGNTYKSGSVYGSTKTQEFELPADWDASKISVITFVFRYSGNSQSPIGEVLQADKVHLVK